MLTIGTSQEGADESTIRQIALAAKMAGADIHHIGDAGFYGIAVPENIMAYSIIFQFLTEKETENVMVVQNLLTFTYGLYNLEQRGEGGMRVPPFDFS